MYYIFDKTETEILKYIQSNLSNVLNDEFSYYNPRIDIKYSYETNEYKLKYKIGVIKNYECEVKIPIHTTNIDISSEVYKYLNIITNNIYEQITGVSTNKDYIEINGIKYYPEKESE